MFVQLSSPVWGLSGKYRSLDFTMVRRNDRQFVRRYTPPSDPKTPDQLALRQRFVEAKLNWSRNLSVAQRATWKDWAVARTRPRGIDNIAGFNAFVSAELNRMALGLGPGGDAPGAGLPGRVSEIEQFPADDSRTFRFRLRHHHGDLTGARVLVETTPATLRTSRAPREGDLRRAAGIGAESFLALRPSGEAYELRGGLHALQPGERFGMRVRIVSAEGVAGEMLCADWIRMEQVTPGEATPAPAPVPVPPQSNVCRAGAAALSIRRARELDRIQTQQLHAFWAMLESLHKAPWRPPWLEK